LSASGAYFLALNGGLHLNTNKRATVFLSLSTVHTAYEETEMEGTWRQVSPRYFLSSCSLLIFSLVVFCFLFFLDLDLKGCAIPV
jgi:hypothetical protein